MKPVICLMGPTTSGKTAVAVELAQQLPLDIISVDSAMVYKSMDIGSAKPDAATLALAPHQLIDIRDPREPYSAGEFRRDALAAIAKSHEQGRIPLLVGGTMLYFRSLQYGLASLPQADEMVRGKLLEEASQMGWRKMHSLLAEVDSKSATRIHQNDTQRIQRALEVYYLTGKPLSELQTTTVSGNFHFINYALMPERAILHERIAHRFNEMVSQGLVEEVGCLFKRDDLHSELPALRSVGYRQVWEYLEGRSSYDEMIERGIIATRQLAKRQVTWLRSWPDLKTVEPGEIYNSVIASIEGS